MLFEVIIIAIFLFINMYVHLSTKYILLELI